jgi:hydroxymethylpyrimidine pyrophosphatase-like HAD family hydrolase
MVFAGDSGNDREALTGPWLGILVGNAPRELAGALHDEAIRTGRADRLYLASASCVRGVMEGCRHFSFL